MLRTIGAHTIRVMTFRHNGAGLYTKHIALILALIAVSCTFALARWGIPVQAAGHAVFIMMLCLFSVRVGVGYALLSVGIDATAMLAWFAPKGLFTAWEFAALTWLAFRVGKSAQ